MKTPLLSKDAITGASHKRQVAATKDRHLGKCKTQGTSHSAPPVSMFVYQPPTARESGCGYDKQARMGHMQCISERAVCSTNKSVAYAGVDCAAVVRLSSRGVWEAAVTLRIV